MAFGVISIFVVLAFIVAIFVYYYNRFIVLDNRVKNSLAQIGVQLKKRADLVPNLIKTVKGYAKHEKKIMDKVTDARKEMMQATHIVDKMKAGNKLESALKSIFAIAENYPQLKANQNFLQLQQELASIEDKIAYSRQYYNDSILSYNNKVQTFPGAFFAGLYGKNEREFLKIPEAVKAVPNIEF